MGVVIDLAAYRSRRALQDVVDRYTEKELDEFWDTALHGETDRRGVEPTYTVIDETQHWTSGWEQLLNEILHPPMHLTDWQRSLLGRIEWTNATPERRRETDRALRILRGTDHGSDDGNAESHRGDPGLPRS